MKNPLSKVDKQLVRAIDAGDIALTRKALEAGAGLETCDSMGFNPLLRAISSSRLEIVEFLLDRGASILLSDREGGQPIHYAVRTKNTAIIHLLLQRGADPNAPYICRASDGEELPDEHGETPLFMAGNYPDVVGLLASFGADMRATNQLGNNALFKYIKYHPEETKVNPLLSVGVDPNQRNRAGDSPIMIVYERILGHRRMAGSPGLVKGYLEAYERILESMFRSGGQRDGFSQLELIDACERGDMEGVTSAVGSGASVQYRGSGPLLSAVNGERMDVIDWLLDHGADINAQSTVDSKWRPLTYAAHQGKTAAVTRLIERGAEMDVETDGMTALAWSKFNGYPAIEKYLRSNSRGKAKVKPVRLGIWSQEQNDQVMAVAGQPGAVAECLASMLGGKGRKLDVERGVVLSSDSHIVFRFFGQKWSMVYVFGEWMDESVAQRVSELVGQSVFFYENSDTAYAWRYKLWDGGALQESLDFNGTRVRFDSQRRIETVSGQMVAKFTDKTVVDLGMTITGLAFRDRPSEEWRFSSLHEPGEIDEVWVIGQ